jgi:hypothetical protein
MTFRIETAERGRFTLFILSGRIDIVLDLKDVSFVDRDVIGFLARREADGVKLENCPAYIREWMEREKD